MRRFKSELALLLYEEAKKRGLGLFGGIWADAVELLSPSSEWGHSLPTTRYACFKELDAAWVRWRAASGLKEQRLALSKLMATAAHLTFFLVKEHHETN